jgi:hypothetical protein
MPTNTQAENELQLHAQKIGQSDRHRRPALRAQSHFENWSDNR